MHNNDTANFAGLLDLVTGHPWWTALVVVIALCFIADFIFEKTPWRWK